MIELPALGRYGPEPECERNKTRSKTSGPSAQKPALTRANVGGRKHRKCNTYYAQTTLNVFPRQMKFKTSQKNEGTFPMVSHTLRGFGNSSTLLGSLRKHKVFDLSTQSVGPLSLESRKFKTLLRTWEAGTTGSAKLTTHRLLATKIVREGLRTISAFGPGNLGPRGLQQLHCFEAPH